MSVLEEFKNNKLDPIVVEKLESELSLFRE